MTPEHHFGVWPEPSDWPSDSGPWPWPLCGLLSEKSAVAGHTNRSGSSQLPSNHLLLLSWSHWSLLEMTLFNCPACYPPFPPEYPSPAQVAAERPLGPWQRPQPSDQRQLGRGPRSPGAGAGRSRPYSSRNGLSKVWSFPPRPKPGLRRPQHSRGLACCAYPSPGPCRWRTYRTPRPSSTWPPRSTSWERTFCRRPTWILRSPSERTGRRVPHRLPRRP